MVAAILICSGAFWRNFYVAGQKEVSWGFVQFVMFLPPMSEPITDNRSELTRVFRATREFSATIRSAGPDDTIIHIRHDSIIRHELSWYGMILGDWRAQLNYLIFYSGDGRISILGWYEGMTSDTRWESNGCLQRRRSDYYIIYVDTVEYQNIESTREHKEKSDGNRREESCVRQLMA